MGVDATKSDWASTSAVLAERVWKVVADSVMPCCNSSFPDVGSMFGGGFLFQVSSTFAWKP